MAKTTTKTARTPRAGSANVTPINVPTIRTLTDGETFSPSIDTTADPRVVVNFTARAAETKPRHVITSTLDFSDVSRETLVRWACRPIIIDMQRRFRTLANSSDGAERVRAMNPATWAAINVQSDVIDAERAASDPFARAKSTVGKLTAEQRAELANMLRDAERAERAAAKTPKSA